MVVLYDFDEGKRKKKQLCFVFCSIYVKGILELLHFVEPNQFMNFDERIRLNPMKVSVGSNGWFLSIVKTGFCFVATKVY